MNIKRISIFLLIIINLILNSYIKTLEKTIDINNKDIKILVLIISSENLPVYLELQKIWRSYMHYDRQHVEAYFIKGNSNLSNNYQIENDIIWSKTNECIRPCILNKTILSLEALSPNLKNFDYVLRTNLSSFYIFPRLLNFLKTCPRKRFYCGKHIGDGAIGCGCGFIMSTDIAEDLIKNKKLFIGNKVRNDDVIIGRYITKNMKIKLTPQERLDFRTIESWENYKDKIEDDIFQFRIKNDPDLRLKNDVYIQSQLLKKFYNKEIGVE